MKTLCFVTTHYKDDWAITAALRSCLQVFDEIHIVVSGGPMTDRMRHRITCAGIDHVYTPNLEVLDKNGKWDEGASRRLQCNFAGDRKATHVAFVDSDEVVASNIAIRVNDLTTVDWPLLNCSMQEIITAKEIRPLALILPLSHPWRPSRGIHQRQPPWAARRHIPSTGTCYHLQAMCKHRLKAKAAWYKLMERIHWGSTASDEKLNHKYDWILKEASNTQFGQSYIGCFSLDDIHIDEEAWQAEEVRTMLKDNRKHNLSGLNLWGFDEDV